MKDLAHNLEDEGFQQVSTSNKKELDERLESYRNNPENLVDWDDIKNDW